MVPWSADCGTHWYYSKHATDPNLATQDAADGRKRTG